MKNKVAVGVIVAVVLIMWGSWISAEKAQAEGVYFELGKTYLASSVTTHGVGYVNSDGWGVGIEATGKGQTRKGKTTPKPIISFYKVTDPNWKILGGNFKTSLGMSYTPDQLLVGPTNFRLEFSLEYVGGAELFIRHYSSAGLHTPNTGIDLVGFRKNF